jgi:type I restriction enzyme S subunit
MEVKPGYKQTEVGTIPDEWDVSSLNHCCSKITDGTHDTPKPVQSGVPFLTAIHVKDNFIDYQSCLYLTKTDHEIIFSRCNPQHGDVLMVNIGAGVATTALVDVGYEFSLKNVALLKPNRQRVAGDYLNYCLGDRKSKIIQELSSGGAQPFLSLTQIGEFKIPVPSTAEQRSIAGALSDVDALLGALGQLIAKKRDLKQAAMQQLLTGQTRLPGFHSEWKVKRLGDVADVSKGAGLAKSSLSASGVRECILYGELFTTYGRVITDVVSRTVALEGRLSRSGDVLLPGSTTTVGIDLAIASALLKDGVALGGDINIVRMKGAQRYDPVFLANYLTYVKKYDLADRAQGITIIHLYGRDLLDLSMELPALAEQTAIAELLTDMDAELAALEQRYAKTRALKQGMMQELLTGRVRLI